MMHNGARNKLYWGVISMVAAFDYGASSQTVLPVENGPLRPPNEVIDEVLADVGASHLCDHTLAAKNKRDFLAIYGPRVEKLKMDYEAWHGPDSPVYELASCRTIINHAEFKRKTRLALRRFASKLTQLERVYRSRDN